MDTVMDMATDMATGTGTGTGTGIGTGGMDITRAITTGISAMSLGIGMDTVGTTTITITGDAPGAAR